MTSSRHQDVPPPLPAGLQVFSEADLLDALAECFVPALRRDIVAAGLLRSAQLILDADAPGAGIPGVPPRFLVRVLLQAPGNDDAVNAQMRAAVENRLLGLPAISRVEVTVTPALFHILSNR